MWDSTPFTFCVRENPWPLSIKAVLVGKSGGWAVDGKDSQGKDAKELRLGQGQVVLHDELDLGSTYSQKMWLPLIACATSQADELESAKGAAGCGDFGRSSSSVHDRMPAVAPAAFSLVHLHACMHVRVTYVCSCSHVIWPHIIDEQVHLFTCLLTFMYVNRCTCSLVI